jgi:predicted nucleic acid-binding protein
MAEYRAVLSRPELRIRKGLQRQLLDFIGKSSHLVSPSRSLRAASDPADDIFIECADAAGADYLITGNVRHFPRFWKKTKVITPRDFITLIAPHLFS